MHALAAQGSEQKNRACINFTQMNLFSKWYCNGNTLPHNWNCEPHVFILVQCNFCMIFQIIVIPVCYHNKFPKFVCNVTGLRSNYKHRLEFPFNKDNHSKSVSKYKFWCGGFQWASLWRCDLYVFFDARCICMHVCDDKWVFVFQITPPPQKKKKTHTHTLWHTRNGQVTSLEQNMEPCYNEDLWNRKITYWHLIIFIGGSQWRVGTSKITLLWKGCYMRALYRDVRVQILFWF